MKTFKNFLEESQAFDTMTLGDLKAGDKIFFINEDDDQAYIFTVLGTKDELEEFVIVTNQEDGRGKHFEIRLTDEAKSARTWEEVSNEGNCIVGVDEKSFKITVEETYDWVQRPLKIEDFTKYLRM